MMRENDYVMAISKATPLNEEELKQVLEYERIILLAKTYEDEITSPSVTEMLKKYDDLIMNATLLPKENKTSNIVSALQRNEKMMNQLEQIAKTKTTDELKLERKNEAMSFSAGFTNASVIIFVVLLVGIIASVLLLSVS